METGVIIETKRLILRRPRPEDTLTLVGLWTDLAVTRYLGGPRKEPALTVALEESVKSPEKFDLWPLIEKDSSSIIGHCGLIEKTVEQKEVIELVYVLHPSVWGRGYAREIGRALIEYGFRELGLPRIVALIDPGNSPS
ncbi:MAG: GNAT family N-acetyltransferase, partial [Spirochaetota bacterium]